MKTAYTLVGIATISLIIVALLITQDSKPKPSGDSGANATSTMPTETTNQTLQLTSPAFAHGGLIPPKYTCDAENVSPPLEIRGVPEGTQSLVLLMDDPDIPENVKRSRGIEKFDHWVLFNIDSNTAEIAEGAAPGMLGMNTGGDAAYTGPCPPDREHRYLFKLYALDKMVLFESTPIMAEVEAAMKGHILAETQLMGRYKRQSGED